jgi:orotidine-5'-phosphate decarboxylase
VTPETSGGPPRPFGDLLADRVLERESQIVLGLDPDPGALWPARVQPAEAGPGRPASGRSGSSPGELAADAVARHCLALIDAAAPACVAVKPQLACFERLGAAGRRALDAVVEHARAVGLLVIADGKRGDIDVTARAYAQALFGGAGTPFGEVRGLGADMATVNPLMGRDALAPFVAAARAAGAGVLALVRTSNPGAADVEDLALAGGGVVWERLAAIVAELGAPGVGAGGLSDVGAVIGATAPDHLARARELMPRAVFLLPGVGAQGGRVEELRAAFAPGRAGGLISASRSIAGAFEASGGDPASAARAEAERLRAAAWELG